MRVLFSSPPVPGVARHPNGTRFQGVLRLEARVYEPGEKGAVGPSGRRPPTVAEWLTDAKSSGSIHVPVPPVIEGAVATPIPAAVLRDLPVDTEVVIAWRMAAK